MFSFTQLKSLPDMRWLPAVLAIIETLSRVVDRIGPVQFEPMEKHPPPVQDVPPGQDAPSAQDAPPGRAADDHTPAMTVDPPADYDTTGLHEPFNDDDGNGVDDGLEP